jgi:AraC-like DNA-binding protein
MKTSVSHSELFESRQIIDQDGRSVLREFLNTERRLSSLGCFVQVVNRHLASSLTSEYVVKPGLFISIVIKAAGKGGVWDKPACIENRNETLVALALQKPMRWWGTIPGDTYLQSVGFAFPPTSLKRLNVWNEFSALFKSANDDAVSASLPLAPRFQNIAAEILAPPLPGNLGILLTESHAAEVLAYGLAALAGHSNTPAMAAGDRMRLHSLCASINANLRRAWTLDELAKEAGLSRRSLGAKFHATFNMTVSEFIRRKRLEFARDALVYQSMTVAEAAYSVGYDNPANFATAFRRHFGHSPSVCKKAQ